MDSHPSAGKDEANSLSHHSLHEQMGQLVDRERVLIGENDQLRAQLVERKEQEKKKFTDLMVQYRQLRDNANIKREDEDDKQGTSNNQVTVKTEWNDEKVKVEIKEEDEEGEDDDIHIKHEYVPAYIKTESSDDEVKVEIKEEYEEDDEDPSTNAHIDTELNIKTESMECDLMEVKDEIKEEDEDDEDCDGDPEIKGEFDYGHEIEIKEEEMEDEDETTNNEVKMEIKEEEEDEETQINDIEGLVQDNQTGGDESRSVENIQIRGINHNQVDDERYEAMQANVDCGQLVSNQSRDSLNDSNGNESIEEGGDNLSHEQLLNTLNEPTEVTTVTQSGDVLSPWISTGQDSSRTALNQQATGSTQHNKRKQAQLKRTDKRSKKTLQEDDGEDEEGGEDFGNEDGEESKVKVLYLNCTESECNGKLDSLVDLHGHLRTVHQLSPFQCFAMDCNSRFDHPYQLGDHIKLHHSQGTRFLCPRCPKEFDSQRKTYHHWYYQHQTGQFQCTFVSDCAQVTDTRCKMAAHQQSKHHSQQKHFQCTHPGCTASFAFNALLKRHQSTHLDSQPFQCIWPQCSHSTNRRSGLVTHIRMRHFGLPKSVKEQKEKNIVDVRDPNEYVRVVADE